MGTLAYLRPSRFAFSRIVWFALRATWSAAFEAHDLTNSAAFPDRNLPSWYRTSLSM